MRWEKMQVGKFFLPYGQGISSRGACVVSFGGGDYAAGGSQRCCFFLCLACWWGKLDVDAGRGGVVSDWASCLELLLLVQLVR